jgi:predicted DNA binding CopG/RHH family protein
MKQPLPKLTSDKEAEEFAADSGLTESGLSEMRMVRFEVQPKRERVNMRLPCPRLDAVSARRQITESAEMSHRPFRVMVREGAPSTTCSADRREVVDGGPPRAMTVERSAVQTVAFIFQRALKVSAAKAGVPYQRCIRQAPETAAQLPEGP